MKDPLLNLSEELQKKLKKKSKPSWTVPMLATLTEDRFSDKDWIFEDKLDGERWLTFCHGYSLHLLSRNQKGRGRMAVDGHQKKPTVSNGVHKI
jgi:bifunctional non-homologous end joining protein LigD